MRKIKYNPKDTYYNTEKERLMREIEQREAQLNALNASVQDTPDRLISESLARKHKISDRSYIKFIFNSLRESRLYGLWERAIKYFRRFRLLATVLSAISYIITIISTGAFFISVMTVLIIAIPFVLLGTAIGLFHSFLNRGRIKRKIEKQTTITEITVIFLSPFPAEEAKGSFAFRTALKLAQNNNAVFIVRPINKYKFERTSENIFLINQMDYFYFNKRLFENGKSITRIHL